MSKQTIAIDVDEVLFPFVPEFTKFHNSTYGTSVSIDDFLSYEFEEVLGLPVEEVIKRIYAFHDVDDMHVEPLSEAQSAIRTLSNRYRLVIITARNPTYEISTRAWIEKNFPAVFSEIVLVGHPSTVADYRSKAEVCKEMNAIALVDDSLNHVLKCNEVGVQGILFGDYPWSSQNDVTEDVVRCKNWQAVVEYFDGQS